MSETPASASVTSSRWEDFIDVFIAPVQLFRRRSDGRFGHGLVVLIVVIGVVFFLTRNAMQPILDAEFRRGMAGNPRMTPEQLETARRIAANFAPVSVIVIMLIATFVLGAVIWLVARMVGGRINYAQGATIATFAYFPRALETIANGAQALLMDEGKLTSRFSVSLGLGRLLDPTTTSGPLLAVLGRVDLFTLWITVLVAVGLKQMTRITTGQAIAGAALVWLIGAIPTLVQALRAG